MAMKTKIDIALIERHYRIEEDGMVWSYRTKRYVKPSNNGGYLTVFLPDVGVRMGLSALVAMKFHGPRPHGMVVSHRDDNSLNSSAGNVYYCSRREATCRGMRRRLLRGYDLPPHLDVIDGKKKAIEGSDGRCWGSVGECSEDLGLSRAGIWKSIKEDRGLNSGVKLSFAR